MRIINWNVRTANPFLSKGLNRVRSLEPDVISLQEFPLKKLSLLGTLPEYSVHHAPDFNRSVRGKEMPYSALITLSRLPVTNVLLREYHEETPFSILKNFFYQKISKVVHKYNSLVVQVQTSVSSSLTIENVHLPCTTVQERLGTVKKLVLQVLSEESDILLGDFNITGSHPASFFVKLLQGEPMRTIFRQERRLVDLLFADFGVNNHFANINTTNYHPLLFTAQFDHVISKADRVVNKEVIKMRGSDHKLLLVDYDEGS
jgi:endonuclease/exonuclease/phosphatase (EEP) superfamily protein YafD